MRRDNRKRWAVYFNDRSALNKVNYAVQVNTRRGMFKPWWKQVSWKEVITFIFWVSVILAGLFWWK